ncbi:Anaphase-promoting complex subunit 11 [Camellia lanceoleosa]|uniref:Anaphase-promoting complex subunit 11 n=1 Tax=Camellia lanceoleosa TaxID=1840588 RepID=A0ACC0F668_9ERIC|nr:Anaphase-promoting complex subunit 11 [Camellia lanceoleosa]
MTKLLRLFEMWHAVCSWTWDAQDETCGICRLAFDGCCPDCKHPGDDCPLKLPLRMAGFGVLHRNEASGALSGLTISAGSFVVVVHQKSYFGVVSCWEWLVKLGDI